MGVRRSWKKQAGGKRSLQAVGEGPGTEIKEGQSLDCYMGPDILVSKPESYTLR